VISKGKSKGSVKLQHVNTQGGEKWVYTSEDYYVSHRFSDDPKDFLANVYVKLRYRTKEQVDAGIKRYKERTGKDPKNLRKGHYGGQTVEWALYYPFSSGGMGSLAIHKQGEAKSPPPKGVAAAKKEVLTAIMSVLKEARAARKKHHEREMGRRRFGGRKIDPDEPGSLRQWG
jgi:hypothetical protein